MLGKKVWDILRNDIVKNMASKNGEGLWNLKDKIRGSANNSNNSCCNGNYSSRGRDDYYNS